MSARGGWFVFEKAGDLWRQHFVAETDGGHEDAVRQVAERLNSGGHFLACARSMTFEFDAEPVQGFRLTRTAIEPPAPHNPKRDERESA